MASITRNDFRYLVGQSIADQLATDNALYCLIGKNTDWDTTPNPPTPRDTEAEYFEFFNEMLTAKKVQATDIVAATVRNNWLSGTVYDYFYRYTADEESDTGASSLEASNFFVVTDTLDVYKCLDNAGGIPSTDKPTGQSTSPFETLDGYVWKYMFTISPSDANKFLTPLFIPVRHKNGVDDGSDQYLVEQAAVPGTIDKIRVVSGGDGYSSPNVVIIGDGTGATATATVTSGAITDISVNNVGSGYTWANVTLSESGSPEAVLKAAIAPNNGHGSNAIEELLSHYIIINCRFAALEPKTPTDSSYRQIGLILNPIRTSDGLVADDLLLYGCKGLTVSVLSGNLLSYETISGAISGASGTIVSVSDDETEIRYTQTKEQALIPFQNGEVITGATSGASSTIGALIDAELEYGKGTLIYVENRKKIERAVDQAEDIKIIIDI